MNGDFDVLKLLFIILAWALVIPVVMWGFYRLSELIQ